MQAAGYYNRELEDGAVYADRTAALLGLARGHRVLHVGCTDSPLTAGRLADGSLLHASLMREAQELHGIDIDEAAVSLLALQIGGTYSVCDISTQQPDLPFEPDVILASDVIEHVADQGGFVRGLRRIAERCPDCVVAISTPNALGIRLVLHTAAGREIIHPDHCLVHTPATLRRVLEQAGLGLEKMLYYNIRTGDSVARRAYDALPKMASRLRPGFADGMIALARKR